MKLKSIAKVLLSCMMAGALFTGCGDSSDKKDAAQDSEVKLGMITHLNANERTMDEIYNKVLEKTKLKLSAYKITYYDNLNSMEMGIESGSVDQISLYISVAKYIIANNDKFEFFGNEQAFKDLSDSFCFAVRKEDTALKANLDKVIGEMKADGSLDKLVKEYITDVDNGQAPSAIEIPTTDGADTIKFGVTGDLPPLDYVSAEGTPAGFNTAILSEIAKRLGKNIEIIDIDSGARASALASKNIDVVFWAILPVDTERPPYIDKSDSVEFSIPYFQDAVAHLQLKK
ncbi:MAG: transporter substrate-binding domain-containing protein [Selenomonadaceae bacterium]|nr:transporter substrate-binding domain-containing protein [Selenomonadaceae bacterium]